MKPAHVKARSTVLGTGELSQALEYVRDREALRSFCGAHVCTAADVSSDGRRLDMPRVLQLMRARGYDVSTPIKPQHQPKARQGLTVWIVHIRLPRAEFDIGFYTATH